MTSETDQPSRVQDEPSRPPASEDGLAARKRALMQVLRQVRGLNEDEAARVENMDDMALASLSERILGYVLSRSDTASSNALNEALTASETASP